MSKKLPVDRGWAWIVLMACVVEFFIMVGFLKSFGLFFVEYMRKYDATSSGISLVLSMQTLFYSVFSVFVMGIGISYFSSRKLVIYGAFMLGVSQICNAFAPSDSFLVFSQGFIFGTHAAFMHGPATLMLSIYFEKKRGMSNTVANIGASVGGLACPLLVRKLLDYYGLSGCLLIVSGMFMNAIVCGALMRPMDISQLKNDELQISSSNFKKIPEKNEQPDVLLDLLKTPIVKNPQLKEHSIDSVKSKNGKSQGHPKLFQSYEKLQAESGFKPKRRRAASESVVDHGVEYTVKELRHRSLQRSVEFHGSFGNVVGSFTAGNLTHRSMSEESIESDKLSNKFHQSNCDDCASKVFDCSLWRNSLFLLFMTYSFFAVPACGLPLNYIPPFAKDFGISDDEIAWLVTISGFCEIVGRCILAFIADTEKLRRHIMVSFCVFCNALACMFSSYFTSYPAFVVYAGLYGLFGGVHFTLYPVVLVDFIGIDRLKHGLAMHSVVSGISISIFSIIVGIIRDATESYVTAFYVYGALGIMSTILLMSLEPLCRRREDKKAADTPVRVNQL